MGNGQSLTVITENSTQFEDDSSNDLNGDESFNLDELAIDTDYVEIEAYQKMGIRAFIFSDPGGYTLEFFAWTR